MSRTLRYRVSQVNLNTSITAVSNRSVQIFLAHPVLNINISNLLRGHSLKRIFRLVKLYVILELPTICFKSRMTTSSRHNSCSSDSDESWKRMVGGKAHFSQHYEWCVPFVSVLFRFESPAKNVCISLTHFPPPASRYQCASNAITITQCYSYSNDGIG